MPDEHRDLPKYEPWVRKDRPRWSYFSGAVCCFLFWPRQIAAWCAILGCVVVVNLIDWRKDVEKEKLSSFRRNTILVAMAFFARCHSFLCGCVYASVKRVHVDYSDYLGPDYEYRYDKVGIHVCNHLHMYDIIVSIYLMWFGGYQASFIGKRELTRYPLLGKLVTPLESLLTS